MHYQQYHGLGNHFIITEYNASIAPLLTAENIQQLCDDKIGIGADGFIIVHKHPLKMEFFNKDGSQASMCGNGIRCFFHYCIDNHIIDSPTKKHIVHTLAGDVIVNEETERIELNKTNDFHKYVKVVMNPPTYYERLDRQLSPTNTKNFIFTLPFKNTSIECQFLDLGVPHLIVNMSSNYNSRNIHSSLDEILSDSVACEKLMNHTLFENGTNINFVNIIDSNNIELLTYERGVGFTTACGTGATASVVSLQNQELLNNKVSVQLKHGHLLIEKIIKDGDSIYTMTGPTTKISEGIYMNL